VKEWGKQKVQDEAQKEGKSPRNEQKEAARAIKRVRGRESAKG